MEMNADDRSFLEHIFESYYDKVYAFLYLRVRNVVIAEDLTSQTFLKVVEKYKTYNPKKGAMSTWIFTIAINLLRSNYRCSKGKEMVNLDDIENLYGSNNVEICLIEKEDNMFLKELLNNLDDRQRCIVALKYYGELSNKEISKLMSISETNVSTILNRAVKKLKNIPNMCDEFSDYAYKSQGEK